MTITHHPATDTLASYASGSLDTARRLVVASHLERCAACRRTVGDFEAVGGAMLEDLPPAPMGEDALAQVLARLDAVAPEPAAGTMNAHADLPACLRSCTLGSWRWIGRGLKVRPIMLPQAGGTRLFLLKGAPGARLPHHVHTGEEFAAVLTGVYTHEGGRFGPGDFDEADETTEHTPVVTADAECICLIALEGRVRMTGLAGALLNPFVRI
ncbi:MAG TPA: ChrR family anti-sigma-E factor [Pseudolabrys sp.]|nr:ChrR family anti-sigma-E factor [Pseudolabrys sp.]